MSVQNIREVDAIGIDNLTGYVTLAIFDSLDWNNEEEHLLLLQEKLNMYLSFLESGEVYSVYEQAKGRDFEIKIHFKNNIPQSCRDFLNNVTEVISKAGFHLNYKVG
ncbi:DUF6572 domain-containing protein [Chengkuizengella sediminis]|uniref:DUF6572 domain-containing protein n=1 Tax=Chengkuizengella sediminis TaxID=1885917 RepID=UPI001F0E5C86|nr:DUF6572 domain-containing protein [Chengkuizengella sediminis]